MRYSNHFEQLEEYKEKVIDRTLSRPNVSLVADAREDTPVFYNPRMGFNIIDLEYPSEVESYVTEVDVTVFGEMGTKITNGDLLNGEEMEPEMVTVYFPENKTDANIERNISFTWRGIRTGMTITQKGVDHSTKSFKYVAQESAVEKDTIAAFGNMFVRSEEYDTTIGGVNYYAFQWAWLNETDYNSLVPGENTVTFYGIEDDEIAYSEVVTVEFMPAGSPMPLGQIIINRGYVNTDGIDWDGDFLPYIGTMEIDGEAYHCYDASEAWDYSPDVYIIAFSQELENGVTYDSIKEIRLLNNEIDYEEEMEDWTPDDWYIEVKSYDPHYVGPLEQTFDIQAGETTQEYEGACLSLFILNAKTSLLSIELPDSMTEIYNICDRCENLTGVTIPNSVNYIGWSVFQGCPNLTDLYYAGTIKQWNNLRKEEGWDYGCNWGVVHCTDGDITRPSLYICTYSDGRVVEYKTSNYDRPNLVAVEITDFVTTINNYELSNCSGLTSVTIGNSVTSIGYAAFSGCTSLTSVTIPNSVTSISYGAFQGCSNLTNLVYADGCETVLRTYATCITSVTIPDSVTSIGDEAFYECNNLTSVTIPNSVINIGNNVFTNCSSLTSVGPKGSGASVEIPDSVTSIGFAAFSWCSGLTNIIIPDSVIGVGASAFANCSSLTSVTISNSITGNIGTGTFSGCTSLVNMTIPNSVVGIGHYAFNSCSSLTGITIPESVTNIGSYTFQYCSSLTSVTYAGTITKWNSISKGYNWKDGVPTTCMVHCTDGDVAI